MQAGSALVPVSAVIPCYNAGPWLRAAIESVLSQSRPVSELLIVDDCSTDASRAIASEYPARLLKTEVNRGHASARNLALREAAHDTMAWLDADDLWDPHHCATVVPLLEAHPSAAVAFSAVRLIGKFAGTWGMPVPCSGPTRLVWESFEATRVPAMSAVTRRQPCLTIGGYREDLRVAPDFDFWLRLALEYPFVWTQEVTASYRWHDSQISRNSAMQHRSAYRARLDTARQVERAGYATLGQAMRARVGAMLDRDLPEVWWRGETERVKVLLELAETDGFDSRTIRQMRWRSKVPRTLVKAWLGVDRLMRAIRPPESPRPPQT